MTLDKLLNQILSLNASPLLLCDKTYKLFSSNVASIKAVVYYFRRAGFNYSENEVVRAFIWHAMQLSNEELALLLARYRAYELEKGAGAGRRSFLIPLDISPPSPPPSPPVPASASSVRMLVQRLHGGVGGASVSAQRSL